MVQIIATFYKFVPLPDCEQWIEQLRDLSDAWEVQGTLLLATEGINGAIAGSAAAVERAIADLRRFSPFADLAPKFVTTPTAPFQRLKIKQKAEIVTFGIPDADPNRSVGTYVAPEDWNALITQPDVVLVDTRNEYEVQVGTFQGAQDPQTASFREFPDYVQAHLDPQTHPKVALFCTGGIRCEKATSYLLQQGFPEVYHLQGGILNYLDQIPPEHSLWQGECFVFDERVTVQQDLTPGHYTLCVHCGYPLRQGTTHCPDCHTQQPVA